MFLKKFEGITRTPRRPKNPQDSLKLIENKPQGVFKILLNHFKTRQAGSPKFFKNTSRQIKGYGNYFKKPDTRRSRDFFKLLKKRVLEQTPGTRDFQDPFKFRQKQVQDIPKILSNFFKNQTQVVPEILSNYFKTKTKVIPEILKITSKNQAQGVSKILSNYFKTKTVGILTILSNCSKTRHKGSLRFF